MRKLYRIKWLPLNSGWNFSSSAPTLREVVAKKTKKITSAYRFHPVTISLIKAAAPVAQMSEGELVEACVWAGLQGQLDKQIERLTLTREVLQQALVMRQSVKTGGEQSAAGSPKP